MGSRIERTTVVLVVVMAFNMAVVGSSSADEWFIEGEKIGALHSAALATAAPMDEGLTLIIEAGGKETVEIKCNGANLVGREAYLSGAEGGMAKSLTLEKCKTTTETGCELEAEGATKNLRNITTSALGFTALLGGPNTKVDINIHPLTKTLFTTIPLTEESVCLGGGGLKPVVGSVVMLSSDGATEAVTHTIMAQGVTLNNSLEVAGDRAYLEGGLALIKLASGSRWSFQQG